MSEYQYYEFQAIDRPLSEREQRELRALSTRAEITSSSLTNEYHWGDFRGDPYKLMAKYFDAFFYYANWGSHWLMLRIPAGLIDLDVATAYRAGDTFNVKKVGDHLLFDFRSESEDSEDWMEEDSRLGRLLPLRADLMAEDLRSLYLGWLVGVISEEMEDDAVEPPVPPGLRQLTPALQSLADFLRLDDDLLAIAAESDTGEVPAGPAREELAAWIAELKEVEKNDLLLNLVEDATPLARAELLQRFRLAWKKTRTPGLVPEVSRRTAGELRTLREEAHDARRLKRDQREAREREKKAREQAEARVRHLDALAQRGEAAWTEVETKMNTKKPKEYEEAIHLLCDLRDLAEREGQGEETRRRLSEIRQRHAKKPALISRLDEAGLKG